MNKHASVGFLLCPIAFGTFCTGVVECSAVVEMSIRSFCVPFTFILKWCFNCCYLHLITCIPHSHYSWDERVDVHFNSIQFNSCRWHMRIFIEMLLLVLLFILWYNYFWCLPSKVFDRIHPQPFYPLSLLYWKRANYRYTNKILRRQTVMPLFLGVNERKKKTIHKTKIEFDRLKTGCYQMKIYLPTNVLAVKWMCGNTKQMEFSLAHS